MGRISSRNKRYFSVVKSVVLDYGWYVFSIEVYRDNRFVAEFPFMPRNEETERAYDEVENYVLTTLNRERCKPESEQHSLHNIAFGIVYAVRDQLPRNKGMLDTFDLQVGQLDAIWPKWET